MQLGVILMVAGGTWFILRKRIARRQAVIIKGMPQDAGPVQPRTGPRPGARRTLVLLATLPHRARPGAPAHFPGVGEWRLKLQLGSGQWTASRR